MDTSSYTNRIPSGIQPIVISMAAEIVIIASVIATSGRHLMIATSMIATIRSQIRNSVSSMAAPTATSIPSARIDNISFIELI